MSQRLLKMRQQLLTKQGVRLTFFYWLAFLLIIFGLFYDSPTKALIGLYKIMLSPSNLLTDYFIVGGIGATFLNAGLLLCLNVFWLGQFKEEFSGPLYAALFTVTGFAFFGKNLYNTLPIMLGAFLYSRFMRLQFQKVAITALFATALGPVVSIVSFAQDISPLHGLILGWMMGIFIGFVISPMAASFLRFHLGYNLYNLGFTCGVLAMAITGVMRAFHLTVDVHITPDRPSSMAVWFFMLLLCMWFLILGFIFEQRRIARKVEQKALENKVENQMERAFDDNVASLELAKAKSARYHSSSEILGEAAHQVELSASAMIEAGHLFGLNYERLLASPGVLVTDFMSLYGSGICLFNSGLLGLLCLAYIYILGGHLNGPVIGGVMTVMGFAAFGKHLRNICPVMLGTLCMQWFMKTTSPKATTALLGALFGTTLAPIAGRFGPLPGFIAGALHAAMVANIGGVHAGLNLYNNGFSGGFVAAILVPLLEKLEEKRRR